MGKLATQEKDPAMTIATRQFSLDGMEPDAQAAARAVGVCGVLILVLASLLLIGSGG